MVSSVGAEEGLEDDGDEESELGDDGDEDGPEGDDKLPLDGVLSQAVTERAIAATRIIAATALILEFSFI